MFVAQSDNTYKVYEQKNAIQKDHRLGSYFISKEKYESLIGFAVQPNDIIVSCAGTIGETYVLPENIREGIINQALMLIRLYYRDIERFYLLYFDFILKEEAYKESKGTAIKNIPPFDILKNFYMPLPPLAEQQRILDEVDNWMSLVDSIDSNKEHLESIIKQTKSKILNLAIHGKLVPQNPADEPASELLRRINPNAEITCDNAHYPQLPSGWAYSRLGDICKLKNGYAFKSGLYSTQGVRIIRIANVQDGYIEDDAPQYYDFDEMKGLDSFLLSDGDLLMSLTGNVGRVCFITKKFLPAALNQRVACVRNNEVPINKEYLYHLFQSEKFVKNCKNSGKGVAQQNISTEWLKEYIVPLPPLLEQDRIVTLIKGIYSYLDTIMESL